jgi:ABC-type molybdenum transport system ATPase subunit/photorepair protein PhrA
MILRRLIHSNTRVERSLLVQLERAKLPNLQSDSAPALTLSIPNSSEQLWAVISPATSAGPGAKVLSSLLKVLAGKSRAQQILPGEVHEKKRLHPSVHPFANQDQKRIGFASFSKNESSNGGNDFQDFSKRYGALREEDHITLFESIMWDQGFEVGRVAQMRILPDKLLDEGVDQDIRKSAIETKQHIEKLSPLLGLHKPGPGSPGGVPLLHQPIISLSNGQTRRARICGALVSLARQQKSDNSVAGTTLLVLDQPYSGLDEPSRDELSSLLSDLHARGSPRAILVLRRQDDLPKGVTHIVDVSADGKVWSGSRKEWHGSKAQVPQGVKGIRKNNEKDIGVGKKEGEEVIMLNNVSVQYGEKVVLDSINLSLFPGSRLIIKGANGSGKTTLLSLLTGTHPQSYKFDDSSYRLFGQSRTAPANATRILNRKIGYFGPDLLSAFPRLGLEMGGLSVGQSIASGFDGVFSRTTVTDVQFDRIHALTGLFGDCIGFRDDRIQSSTASTDITDTILKRPFIDLNGGSQAVVLFLRAVIHQPALLILDEPFQGMDAMQIARIREYLDASTPLNSSLSSTHQDAFAVGRTTEDRAMDAEKRKEMALVLVSHYVNEWPDRMGKYMLLDDGKVVERI